MSTLADAATRAAMRQRIVNLMPQATRQWGKMTPHQMVCHLSDAFRMADGSRQPKSIDNLITRSLIRFVALHTSMKWPPGAKTVPEADQHQQGTAPDNWHRDLDTLLQLFDTFAARDRHPHPLFGPLTATEWNIWAYRHTDHHLRQFSA
jgi:hypothetical protein